MRPCCQGSYFAAVTQEAKGEACRIRRNNAGHSITIVICSRYKWPGSGRPGSTGNTILTARQVVRVWQNPNQGSLPSETKRCRRSKDKSAAKAAKKPNLKRRPPGREARLHRERREGDSDEGSPVPLSYPTAEKWRNISRVLPSGNDNPPLSKIDTPRPPSPPSALQQPTLSRICLISADAVGKGIQSQHNSDSSLLRPT